MGAQVSTPLGRSRSPLNRVIAGGPDPFGDFIVNRVIKREAPLAVDDAIEVAIHTVGGQFIPPAFIGEISKPMKEAKQLADLQKLNGCDFPGCEYRPSNRKIWMHELNPKKIRVNEIVWPGTHDSATNGIGTPVIIRPFAECQTLSVYDQLVAGARVLDIRVRKDRLVCHAIIPGYTVDVVIQDVKKFLSETKSEIIILEVRTESGQEDPPEFDKYLVDQLGDFLIHQNDTVFEKTISQLLPKRIICVWKPKGSPQPKNGDPLWSSKYLKDNWINTELPFTKFQSNLKYLSEQPPVSARTFFYRVENTCTTNATISGALIQEVTRRIHGYARLFIKECFAKGLSGKLQVLSTDFIDADFVDACVGVTYARVNGKA